MIKIDKIKTDESFNCAHFIDDTVLENNILKITNIIDHNIEDEIRVIKNLRFGFRLFKIHKYNDGISNLFYSDRNYNSNMYYYHCFLHYVETNGYKSLRNNLKKLRMDYYIFEFIYDLIEIELKRFECFITETYKYNRKVHRINKLMKIFANSVKESNGLVKLKYISNVKYKNYNFYIVEISNYIYPIYLFNTGAKLETSGEYIESKYNYNDLLSINNMNILLNLYRELIKEE